MQRDIFYDWMSISFRFKCVPANEHNEHKTQEYECELRSLRYTGWRKKTGPPSHCKYSEIPRPNCVEIGELLQYYMLNTVINFLFKNLIALWRHLAKTKLLSDAEIYLYNVNKLQ